MRGWALTTGLTLLGLAFSPIPAISDHPAPAPKSVHILFFGYQQLNGEMFFQLHVDELAPTDQPPLVKSGARLNFGPYQVGAFHEVAPPIVNPGGNRGMVNLSTLQNHQPQYRRENPASVPPPSEAVEPTHRLIFPPSAGMISHSR